MKPSTRIEEIFKEYLGDYFRMEGNDEPANRMLDNARIWAVIEYLDEVFEANQKLGRELKEKIKLAENKKDES